MLRLYIQNTHTHTSIMGAYVCVCGTFSACPACLPAVVLIGFRRNSFYCRIFLRLLMIVASARQPERERVRERDNCVHMLVHVHMQLSCFCFTSTFIFSCRFLRPFLMRRKMKSFSGFFSGHFPATSLSATVCLLFCTQMLTFFPTSLYLFLSGCLHSKYIFALMNKVFFRLPASALCFAGRQARQGQIGKGGGAWFSIGMWQVFCLNIV